MFLGNLDCFGEVRFRIFTSIGSQPSLGAQDQGPRGVPRQLLPANRFQDRLDPVLEGFRGKPEPQIDLNAGEVSGHADVEWRTSFELLQALRQAFAGGLMISDGE